MNGQILEGRAFDRYWLLTSTTYGSWLPGDDRGFVSNVRVNDGPEVRHNRVGEEYDREIRGLAEHSRQRLLAPMIEFSVAHAETLLKQFQETASHRRWWLLAAAVMATHKHLVVGVPGDPSPDDLLRDFKGYGSRALNKRFGRPASETWWTESGSKRKLPTVEAILGAIRYVLGQQLPRLIWVDDIPELGFRCGRVV